VGGDGQPDHKPRGGDGQRGSDQEAWATGHRDLL
jgi:hypothetical protein